MIIDKYKLHLIRELRIESGTSSKKNAKDQIDMP